MSKKLFVYGSCVSRDALALCENDFELVKYIARSSFASNFASKAMPISYESFDKENKVASNFQKKMLQIDLFKKGMFWLKQNNYDAILVDLIDERFGLVRFKEALYTLSSEAKSADFHTRQRGHIQLLKPDNKERITLWRKGFARMVAHAKEHNVPIFLNKVFWANTNDKGEPLDEKRWRTEEYNGYLKELYAIAESFENVHIIEYPKELLVCDANHKWGESPFHYVHGLYEHTIAELEKALND